MLKFCSCLLFLSLISPHALAIINNDQKQLLLDKVLWGEAHYRDDFVKNSLYRLELMAPDDPEVLAAQIRFAVRQKNLSLAEKKLNQLKQIAGDSSVYKKAQMSVLLAQPQTQQKLRQARVSGMAGHYVVAKTQYDALFHQDLPTPEFSYEYWFLVSKIPEQQQNAFNHLQQLYDYLKNHRIYPDNSVQQTWLSGLEETLSRLWTIKGNNALDAKRLDLAQKAFQQALTYSKTNYSAWVGLGDVAFEHKNMVEAEKAYKQALLISPDKGSAIYGLLGIYKQQSLKKALAFLDSFPEDLKIKFQDARAILESDIFQEHAGQFEKTNQWRKAIEQYSQALQKDPKNIWLIYNYATALMHLGENQKANKLFLDLVAKEKNNPQQVYAYALFLSKINKSPEAIAHLHTISTAHWNNNMRQLAQRLTTELILEKAQQMRDAGDKQGANAYLLQQKQTVQIKMLLADWAFTDNEYAKALNYYQDVLHQEPFNANAYLGTIETHIALKNNRFARSMLEQAHNKKMIFNLDMQRRIADAWLALDEPQKALALFNRLKKQSAHAPPSQTSALIYRDAARVELQVQQPKIAQKDFKRAMINSQITSVWPTTNDSYTYLTRNHLEDDWLKHSIRSEAAQLYRQQETRITLNEDYWRLSGNPGTTDLGAEDTIANAEWGLYNGRAFLRGDRVTYDAGSFPTVNGVYFDEFGTCAINGCTKDVTQRATGIGWDGGWQNNRWGLDLGQTPIGFPVSNWVGGINYGGELYHIGWSLTASRRPMTNSLLSFAGAVDPNTGITWGGVVATGLTLSLSYDRGEANGFWANIIASRLTGQNVETNQRILLMDGYYYKIINEENRRLILGLNNMAWHYQKNLYGFTLGQGGYYSPDSYVALTVPLNYRKRTANWSYELGGTVTLSYATTKDNLLYPLTNLDPILNQENNTFQSGGNGLGYGYSFLAIVERRLGSHFVLGGFINMQQSTDYTPSHFSLYLRYSIEGWQGDMDLPIVTLIPYSNFR